MPRILAKLVWDRGAVTWVDIGKWNHNEWYTFLQKDIVVLINSEEWFYDLINGQADIFIDSGLTWEDMSDPTQSHKLTQSILQKRISYDLYLEMLNTAIVSKLKVDWVYIKDKEVYRKKWNQLVKII